MQRERDGCRCQYETPEQCRVHDAEAKIITPAFGMHDSGRRREFRTGAVRDIDESKPRPDLISPFALLRVGQWMALGARKYGERNWEKGIPVSACYASMMRHALKWAAGERDEDHLAAVVFNAQAIMHYEALGRADLDDMPKHGRKEVA